MATTDHPGDPTSRRPAPGDVEPSDLAGNLADVDGTPHYVVRDVDRMPPFLMSIVSDGDRWMFLSSGGGLTAGRRDAAHALFPYETDDRLHLLAGLNGSVTAIRIHGRRSDAIWRPMIGQTGADGHRTLSKSVPGDAAVFTETDIDAGLTFSYRWASGDRFGFIRTATLTNDGDRPVSVDIVDGIRNILPHGLDPALYLPKGNLTNAYKRGELIDEGTRLATFSLESMVTDRAEPSEALQATVTWSTGLEEATVSLRPDAVRIFESKSTDYGGDLVTGVPGAYFLTDTVDLEPGQTRTWHIVADVALDQSDVASLRNELRGLRDPEPALEQSISATRRALVEIMDRADAAQCTGDEIATAHHFSNVTYNVMRGGLPMDGYAIDIGEFMEYLSRRNATVATRHGEALAALGNTVNRTDLLEAIARTDDVDLVRLGNDYLPFSFSRRHGDPSRPWNAFSIQVTSTDGSPVNHYEGNWRDIFQNWEATAMSFPDYLAGMVSVFVNASTPDGFNPYRITSDGIDWEVPDPDDPWGNIGYWGDHQITYLLRLLEAHDRYRPGEIARLLSERRFTYANVPYRIVPYDQMLTDPKSTIDYDEDAVQVIEQRIGDVGADGRLVWDGGSPYTSPWPRSSWYLRSPSSRTSYPTVASG